MKNLQAFVNAQEEHDQGTIKSLVHDFQNWCKENDKDSKNMKDIAEWLIKESEVTISD